MAVKGIIFFTPQPDAERTREEELEPRLSSEGPRSRAAGAGRPSSCQLGAGTPRGCRASRTSAREGEAERRGPGAEQRRRDAAAPPRGLRGALHAAATEPSPPHRPLPGAGLPRRAPLPARPSLTPARPAGSRYGRLARSSPPPAHLLDGRRRDLALAPLPGGREGHRHGGGAAGRRAPAGPRPSGRPAPAGRTIPGPTWGGGRKEGGCPAL